MVVSEVLLIVGFIGAATFGFLNGWLLRRLFSRPEDLSVENVPAFSEAPASRWANGPRAVLLETRDRSEVRTSHGAGVTAVATFDRESDTQPFAGVSPDDPPQPPAPPELAAIDDRIPDLERQLDERTVEAAELRTRVNLLDPLVERIRERDEWLTEMRLQHGEALVEKEAELSRCESRIAVLETMFSDLQALATTIEDVGTLRERVAAREARRRRPSPRRSQDDAPSMSALSGLA